MNIRLDELVQAIAEALDIVENELIGASTHHGKRVAALCALMGKEVGMGEEEIKALTTCALFHDNALTEFKLYMHDKMDVMKNAKLHCEYGQRNIENLPFKTDISGIVKYHHERADGDGFFGKKADEVPLGAQLICIADILDVEHHLQRVTPGRIPLLQDEIVSQSGKHYTKTASDAMLAILNTETLESLHDENIAQTASKLIPEWQLDIEDSAMFRIAELIARIIDCKSEFTRKHTTQIANRAWLMSGYYGFSPEKRAKIYLAAALHDLGKLATPNEILDKPGALTHEEFVIIKNHVRVTHDLLCEVTGLEEICRWASSHHEKLDGSGYCFGKSEEELDFVDRLIACTDIYQAVSEARPYHSGRSHAETMTIMWNMANKGFIDSKIVKDFDEVMAQYSNTDIPSPHDCP